jgi:hypothetical protein
VLKRPNLPIRILVRGGEALGLVLALDSCGHDLVEDGLHEVELELADKVEELDRSLSLCATE